MYTCANFMAVLVSTVMISTEPPHEAHGKYPLLCALHRLPCVISLPYETTTPDPLSSPPVGGTSLGLYLVRATVRGRFSLKDVVRLCGARRQPGEDTCMDSLNQFREYIETLEQHTETLERRARMVARRLCCWGRMACGVVMLLGVLGISLGSMTLAHADVIQCGDVLGPGGRFELTANLECDAAAVTLRDGATLDLKGHIVICRDFPCVVLTGAGAQLLNGAVQGGVHESITLEGTGGHTVRNVTSTLVDANILVLSDHNRLINVMAESVENAAFFIAGNHNRLTDSIALCPGLSFADGCISVRGNENRLIDNFATATGRPSFVISGNNNVLRGNRAIMNDDAGILVTGTGNRLQRNTALENAIVDLADTHGDCAHNTWRQNTFRTSDPACIQ
jgi:parallel beta-helix repeat protein